MKKEELAHLGDRFWNSTLLKLHHLMDKPRREHDFWREVAELRTQYLAELEQYLAELERSI